jgi:hypothetical protein
MENKKGFTYNGQALGSQNETPLSTLWPVEGFTPQLPQNLEKGPGNLGSYPFLKIHGYPVCIYIRIQS